MKHKRINKLKIGFTSALILLGTGVITTSLISADSAPIRSDATTYQLGADFKQIKGSHVDNFSLGVKTLGSFQTTAYRYASRDNYPDSLALKPMVFNPDFDFANLKPLPGSYSNDDPIKGITQIKLTYTGIGRLYWDNNIGFPNNNYVDLTGTSYSKTFENDYPCFFKVTTNGNDIFNLNTFNLIYDDTLGYVDDSLYPSGYNHYRLPAPKNGATTMPTDVSFSSDYSSYTINQSQTYINNAKLKDITGCVNQLMLFKNSVDNLYINKPQGYTQNDGYVNAFNNTFLPQTYYEYDVPVNALDGGRGVGRLVLFPKGLDKLGYQNEPVVVFTDDHYLTFQEYLNYGINGKAVFGPRFKAEGMMGGYTWSPSTTIGLKDSGTPNGPAIKDPTITINSDTSITLGLNEMATLSATIKYAPGTYFFYSENTNIARFEGNDIIGVNVGETNIYATANLNNGRQVTSEPVKVRVIDLSVPQEVSITPNKQEILVNTPIQLLLDVKPSTATLDFVWSKSCSDEVATISDNGLLTPLKADSEISITATSLRNPLASYTAYFKIVDALKEAGFRKITSQNEIVTGDYIILASSNVYFNPNNPSQYVTSDESGNPVAAEVDANNAIVNPDLNCVIKIIKNENGTYYILNKTTNNYIYVIGDEKEILNNSQTPVELDIAFVDGIIQIKAPGFDRFIQYNKGWSKGGFRSYSPGNGNLKINLYASTNSYEPTNFNKAAVETFINDYMHMEDYTIDQGWCKDETHHYYQDARQAFNNLTNEQRLLLSSDSAYANAWLRLNKWAEANDELIILNTNGGVIFKASQHSISIFENDDKYTYIMMLAVSSIAIIGIAAFISCKYVKSKKHR